MPAALFLFVRLQLLAQVSYLKAISGSYQPTHVLQPTTSKVWCHGGAHKSIRDVLDGCAAGVSIQCQLRKLGLGSFQSQLCCRVLNRDHA